jgi:hypothetical protein
LTKIRSAPGATALARPITAWRAQNLAQNIQKSGRKCAARYLQIGVECLTIRLSYAVGDDDLANRMFELETRYSIAIGIVSMHEASLIFGSTKWVKDFSNRHEINESLIYAPAKVEAILIAEMCVDKETASRFTDCQEAYMREIGIM